MKTISFFLAAAGLVAAQNLSGEPACATPCLMTAISSVCGAQATDQACACASQGAVGQAAVNCLLSNCNSDDLVQAQSAGAALCVEYYATAGSGTASMTGAPTSTTAASSSSSASSGSATSSDSTITSSASLTTSTSPESSSSESSSGTSSRTSSSSSGTSSASGSAASASSTAGAAVMQGPTVLGAGLLGLFVAGVAAL